MSDFTVRSIEWTTASRAVLEHRPEPILSAVLEVGGHSLHVSRYTDEPVWCADAHFGPEGMPHFCHGLGSRVCTKQTLSADVAAELDAVIPARPVQS